jgi:hypothetical protein
MEWCGPMRVAGALATGLDAGGGACTDPVYSGLEGA